jgi:carbamoyl-phosphate synthase large subunit
MKRLIITGAGGSAGIGFTRCIRKANERIFTLGTDTSERMIHFAETDKKALVPRADSKGYIDALNELISKFKIDMLHAQPDLEIKRISEDRERLNCIVFLPSKEAIRICSDKFKLQRKLMQREVPTPKAIKINSKKDLVKAFEEFGNIVWLRAIKGAGGRGSLLVKNIEHGIAWIDYWSGWGSFMANEYLPNENYGYDLIFKDGELYFAQGKQRIEYMLQRASPSGITGTAGIVKAVKNKEIEELAINAVYVVDKNPNGAYAVDLKVDVKGIAKVTEINAGRFLTSSLHFFYITNTLAPHLYIKLAFGEEVKKGEVKPIKHGKIMVRNLDCYPLVFDEDELAKLSSKRKKSKYVII